MGTRKFSNVEQNIIISQLLANSEEVLFEGGSELDADLVKTNYSVLI